MQPPHSSYFGTPTFRSTYHFPILPQSRELRDYHQWRRLGDAALLSRQQVKDAEFKRLQEELARPGIAARRQPPRRRSTTQKPKEPTKEPERQPSPQSRSQGRVRRSLGSFSRARKEILNYSGWRETLLLIFLLCTTTLLSPPSSLDPMSRQNTYGSAESIEFQAVTRYELVPEVKQWAVYPIEHGLAAPMTSESLSTIISSDCLEPTLEQHQGMSSDPQVALPAPFTVTVKSESPGIDTTAATSSNVMATYVRKIINSHLTFASKCAAPTATTLMEMSSCPARSSEYGGEELDESRASKRLTEFRRSPGSAGDDVVEDIRILQVFSRFVDWIAPATNVRNNGDPGSADFSRSSDSSETSASSIAARDSTSGDSGPEENPHMPFTATSSTHSGSYQGSTTDIPPRRFTTRTRPPRPSRHRPLKPGEVWHHCEQCSQYHV